MPPRAALSSAPQPSPKHQEKLFRFTLTGKGKGNHKIVFDVVSEDGKAAIRLAREIMNFHDLRVEEMK